MSDGPSLWNPDQYERFKDERSRPFYDLLALVRPRAGMRVVDLGCGTGELTRDLHAKLGATETIGVDGSESMLARSAPFAGGGLRFEQGRIEDWAPDGTVDLVFSNAALHWVEGHEALLARLAGMLAPGGQIAVQVPSNEGHASHVVAAEVAQEEPFREALGGFVRRVPNLALEQYAAALDRLGFTETHVRMQVYGHHLAGPEDVVEWVKGTTLTAYEKRMPAEMYGRFVRRYREVLMGRLGGTGGKRERGYFFPFKRTLFWGGRG